MPQAASRVQTATRVQNAARTLTTRAGARFSAPRNTYISVPDNAALDVTGKLTVMVRALLYPGDGGSATQGYCNLIYKMSSATNPSGWELQSYTTYPGYVNVYNVALGLGPSAASFAANTGGLGAHGITMTDAAWHHYALVWDGQNLNPYVDGTIPWGGQANTTDWAATTDPLYLGVGVNGILADAVVYNGVALSAAQIAAVSAGGAPPAGYTAWWRLNESSGTTAHDSGPNGLDGTLTNGVQWSMPAPAR